MDSRENMARLALKQVDGFVMIHDPKNNDHPLEEDVQRFMDLADQIYITYSESMGGPLHVELDDGNYALLTGDHATKSIYVFKNALWLISMGKAPEEFSRELSTGYVHAWSFKDNPGVLVCAIELLMVTRDWSVEAVGRVFRRWRELEGDV